MNAVVKCAQIAVAAALFLSSSPPVLAAATNAAASSDAWPMSIATGGGSIVLSEPQVRSWPKYTSMSGIAAVEVTLPGATAAVYGSLSFSSLASADVSAGMVSLVNPKVIATTWPTSSTADAPALDAFVKANLHLAGKPVLPLAMVISSIPRSDRPRTVPPRTNPPVIYVTQRPGASVPASKAGADVVHIALAGPPQFASIPGTQLRYVTNTQSDVFFSRDTTLWYVLLGGRWFSAANLNGPWTFASGRLPADFKKIPENSPRGRVLGSVPGTTQAFYAANVAQAPLVTPVDPAAKLTVTYTAGKPVFASIAGTSLRYAVNASTDVVEVSAASYYACTNAVWFTATAPTGPWTAATYVPAVIYTIPASSPLYRLTFVHIYDARGVALTAPPATPAPRPDQTYHNFGANEFSNGDSASYYITDISSYFAFLPTYGNYASTTYARQQAAAVRPRSAAMKQRRPPGHGPHIKAGPGTNIYAAADGVYRYAGGTWEKNGAGNTWSAAADEPATLRHDRRARLAGYAGTIR